MEIVLLLVIIVVLILKLNSISGNLERMNANMKQLKESIQKLSIQETKTIVHEPVVSKVVESPILKKPEIPKEVVPEVIDLPKAVEVVKVLENKEPPIVVDYKVPSQVQERKPSKPTVPQKTWWERFREQNPDLEKFVGENLISKIGILILVLGISYFVKFAIDKNWINETARVGIGVLCGAILMGVAHRLRLNFKAFSSVLVAGAVAVFYFTIAIAFHQYHIFSQTVAFVIMVVITAFSVLISVSYNRMELAILSLIGGFAVPFMLSTGEGNYKVLFTYIAILDIGILAIASVKRWSLVNILSFGFTVLLFGGWLGTKVIGRMEAPYLGALFFGTLFYIIFTLVNIINNLKTKGAFHVSELVVLTLNTFLYFSAGMFIFMNFHPELKGVFTISLAVANLASAWFLYKKFGLDKNAIYLFIGLTLTFLTLAIPLQFSGNYITLFWAAEAVLLLWLSQKSQIVHFLFTSVVVHLLMAISLLMDWNKIYIIHKNLAYLFLNEGFVAGIFSAISLFLVYYLTRKENKEYILYGQVLNSAIYGQIVKIASLLVLYITGFLEVKYHSTLYFPTFYSQVAVLSFYHLAFSSVVVWLLQKSEKHYFRKIKVLISAINVGLYVFLLSSLPFGELREKISLISNENIAFILHYFSLICTVFFGIVVWKDYQSHDTLKLKNQKYTIWIAAFAVIFVASSELLLHGIALLTEPVKEGNNNNFYIGYQRYMNSFTSVVKVGFPILWGLLSILFLTIGIKKHLRNLRIVALSLLGITIVKLFTYDISNASETGKIIAFILLGIMILVMSFAYQKIKKIVLENEKSDKVDKDEK